jgi:uncharacterized protein YqeY
MKLIEQISADFMAAYKNKEMAKKDFLGVLKTEVTKESKTPEDAYVVAKIKSMIKNAAATDSLSETELVILNGYLPSQLDETQLTSIVSEFLSNNEGASVGSIMGYLKKNYDGQYDGSIASSVAKSALV